MDGQPKIIVVEDERPIARALQLKLKSVGFDVSVAYNGQEALAHLEKQTFDLMILDLMMPLMDGFGVLESLSDKHSLMPIMVSTNLSQEEDRRRAKELGAKDYYVKSDTPISEVVERVQAVLGGEDLTAS